MVVHLRHAVEFSFTRAVNLSLQKPTQSLSLSLRSTNVRIQTNELVLVRRAGCGLPTISPSPAGPLHCTSGPLQALSHCNFSSVRRGATICSTVGNSNGGRRAPKWRESGNVRARRHLLYLLLFHRLDPKRINAITPSRHFSSSGRVCVCVCIAVWAEFSALHRTCRSESPDTTSKLIPTTMSGRSDRAPLLDDKGRAKTYGSTSADLSHRDRRSSDSSVDLEQGSDGSLTPVNDTSRAGSVKEDERPPKKFREIWVLCLGLFSA